MSQSVHIEEADIYLVEGDQPAFTFILEALDPATQTIVPYELGIREVRFLVRKSKNDADPPVAEYLSTGASPQIIKVTASKIVVQVGSAATENPGKFRYFLQTVDGTRHRTIRRGNWIVEDQ